jgi:DNA-binding winged helix-turn-helix (wHTH) protein
VVKLGDGFELDSLAYELRSDGHSLKMERIPMEILFLLVEHRGQLVSREQIADRVWSKDVFVDTDNGINAAMHKIRHALKDDFEQPRFVQTVTGKGYRFIAPVIEPPVAETQSPAQKVIEERLPLVAQPRRMWAIVGGDPARHSWALRGAHLESCCHSQIKREGHDCAGGLREYNRRSGI